MEEEFLRDISYSDIFRISQFIIRGVQMHGPKRKGLRSQRIIKWKNGISNDNCLKRIKNIEVSTDSQQGDFQGFKYDKFHV